LTRRGPAEEVRSLLTAARTLALVRRLALPVLVAQVNVAGRQVNKAVSGP
jgi:hypothetical protein